jgi:hypothetical protein
LVSLGILKNKVLEYFKGWDAKIECKWERGSWEELINEGKHKEKRGNKEIKRNTKAAVRKL